MFYPTLFMLLFSPAAGAGFVDNFGHNYIFRYHFSLISRNDSSLK